MPYISESNPVPEEYPNCFSRILQMTLIWAFFGALVGISTSPIASNPLRILSGMLAGLIVLPAFGIVTGLFGARTNETICGSACGVITILLLAIYQHVPPLGYHLGCGMMTGALIGSTFPPFLRAGRSLVKQISS